MTQRNSQVTLLNSGEFAKLCKTTKRTIQLYEKKGLLIPIYVNKETKYRYYSPELVRTLIEIKFFQKCGFSLKEIKKNLVHQRGKDTITSELNKLEHELQKKRIELNLLKKLNNILFDQEIVSKQFKKNKLTLSNLLIYTVEEGQYEELLNYIKVVREKAIALKLRPSKVDLVMYHEYNFSPQKSRISVAVICNKDPEKLFNEKGPFSYIKKYQNNVISFSFTGPYQFLTLIHQQLDHYIEEQKIRVATPILEIYEHNQLHTNNEFNFITKIAYPTS